MKAQTFLLAASAVAGALAVPLQERDVVMYTVTQDVVDIVSITSTVWVSPSEYTAAPAAVESAPISAPAAAAYTPAVSHHRHGHAHSHAPVASSSSPAAAYTPPTSAPVAVTPTTTSIPETPSSTATPTPPSTSTTPTSTYVAPTTSSSSVYTPPAPITPSTTSTPTPSTTSTPIAIPTTLIPVVSTSAYVAPVASSTPSTGGSYGGSGSNSGEATFYAPGLGSCGDTNDSSELIVAISHTLMDAAGGSNGNPLCGKQIKATASDTGKSVTVSVKDRCTGCAPGDLDFTETGFEQLGHSLDDGRFDITWSYVS